MPIRDLTPDQLKAYIETHHERQYVLVDVRQPGEYTHGHIPGARLIPLPRLVQTMDDLPVDKTLVFYCHSGGRSQAAAAMAAEEMSHRSVYNLKGGMLAWNGASAADLPNVRLFEGLSGGDRLRTAMDLEKGAWRFYRSVAQGYAQEPWTTVFDSLAGAEQAHAEVVYAQWRKIDAGLPDFEILFEQLEGEVLEGGTLLSDALQAVSAAKNQACPRLIELALKIEYSAFDLYRSIADQSMDKAFRDVFYSIAQSEKGHMRSLSRAIDQCRL